MQHHHRPASPGRHIHGVSLLLCGCALLALLTAQAPGGPRARDAQDLQLVAASRHRAQKRRDCVGRQRVPSYFLRAVTDSAVPSLLLHGITRAQVQHFQLPPTGCHPVCRCHDVTELIAVDPQLLQTFLPLPGTRARRRHHRQRRQRVAAQQQRDQLGQPVERRERREPAVAEVERRKPPQPLHAVRRRQRVVRQAERTQAAAQLRDRAQPRQLVLR